MARRPGPAVRKAPISETALHLQVARFLRAACPADVLWFHVPNGEKRDGRTGGKLKAMGVLAGVPDFVFILPNGQAAFIELKTAAGVLSDAQIVFRDAALAKRCGYSTARSLAEVEAVLTRWLAAYDLTLKGRIAA